jgi:mRNA interferase MazF
MPLTFHPEVGTVVICDYSTGFKVPEMVKRRLAVVISPRLKRRDGLCTVVPLSESNPEPVEAWHHQVTLPKSPPKPFEGKVKWAKCDMLATVGFHRLSLPFEKRDGGPRKYVQMRVGNEEMTAIMNGVRSALGIAIAG